MIKDFFTKRIKEALKEMNAEVIFFYQEKREYGKKEEKNKNE
ncbi:MAG: hypothetical protein QXM27_02840 [Candidatus Pacearchaeota archaeon]